MKTARGNEREGECNVTHAHTHTYALTHIHRDSIQGSCTHTKKSKKQKAKKK